jgi:hypothetical protein
MRYGLTATPINQMALQNQVAPYAGRFLQDTSKPPRVLSGVGFVPWTFNGRIAEVELDQKAIVTRFKVDTWYRPASQYLKKEFARLRDSKESHPHEAQVAGKRAAQGAAASSAPVQPGSNFVPPTGGATALVQCGSSLGNGTYNGTMIFGAATSVALAGVTSGSACILINGPEFNNSGVQLQPGGYAVGFVVGTDTATSKPLVVICSFGFNQCSNNSSGATS